MKGSKGTHRRVVAGSLGASHAARGCSVEALFHYQVDGRQLATLRCDTSLSCKKQETAMISLVNMTQAECAVICLILGYLCTEQNFS